MTPFILRLVVTICKKQTIQSAQLVFTFFSPQSLFPFYHSSLSHQSLYPPRFALLSFQRAHHQDPMISLIIHFTIRSRMLDAQYTQNVEGLLIHWSNLDQLLRMQKSTWDLDQDVLAFKWNEEILVHWWTAGDDVMWVRKGVNFVSSFVLNWYQSWHYPLHEMTHHTSTSLIYSTPPISLILTMPFLKILTISNMNKPEEQPYCLQLSLISPRLHRLVLCSFLSSCYDFLPSIKPPLPSLYKLYPRDRFR